MPAPAPASPFSLADWHRQFATLALDCAGADRGAARDMVRAAHRLLGAAPADWRERIGRLPAIEIVAALLDAGGDTDAALALIEGWAGYMLSYGPGGRHLATIALPRTGAEVSAEGASAALALIGALAEAVAGANMLVRLGSGETAPAPGARLN